MPFSSCADNGLFCFASLVHGPISSNLAGSSVLVTDVAQGAPSESILPRRGLCLAPGAAELREGPVFSLLGFAMSGQRLGFVPLESRDSPLSPRLALKYRAFDSGSGHTMCNGSLDV